jgi:hypothetical protein
MLYNMSPDLPDDLTWRQIQRPLLNNSMIDDVADLPLRPKP